LGDAGAKIIQINFRETARIYASHGIVLKENRDVLRSGPQASHAYFLAKYLGCDAAMYDGSYQE
jgi:3-mercaptopyruvate sulfurtransferase SseA